MQNFHAFSFCCIPSVLSAVAKSKAFLPCIDVLRSIKIAKMSVRQASVASQCSSRNSCAHSGFLSCKNIASLFLSSYTRLFSSTAAARWNEKKFACISLHNRLNNLEFIGLPLM